MIRVRNTKGELRELPSSDRFVEICDELGTVAFAVYETNEGLVVIVEPDTAEGRRYARTFNVEFAKYVTLPKFITESNT
jgi:hypothetical protein